MAETIKKGSGDIDPAKLKQILGNYRSMKDDMDEARGDIGNMLKNAENDLGLHRGAFKLAAKLNGQSPEKRADFLRAFDSYRHILELDDQPDMLDEAAKAA